MAGAISNCFYIYVLLCAFAGYLRLKRRYRILCIIRDLKTARAYIEPSDKVQLEKLQTVSISNAHAYSQ